MKLSSLFICLSCVSTTVSWRHMIQRTRTAIKHVVKKSIPAALVAATIVTNPSISYSATDNTKLFEEVWTIVYDSFYDDNYNKVNWDQIKQESLTKLNNGGNQRQIITNALSLLNDKYTRLLDKEKYESLWKYDAIGIGVLFQSDPGKDMTVSAEPLPGSSSDKAGIKKGDIIISMNGEKTQGKTALQMLDYMSNDESKEIILEYKHPADSDEIKKVTLARVTEEVVNPVTYSIEKVNNKYIGYIKLAEFNSKAVPGIEEALQSFKNQDKNIDDIILDLRGNLGGGFQFALNIGGMFMKDQLMVTAMGRNHETNTFKSSYPQGIISNNKPLIILTDELSASASEVLASGLHDNCKAVLIGSKTFGKGKIQAVFGLSDGSGMTMTVAQYISPRGTIIQGKGIQPDISLNTLNPYVSMLLPPVPGLNKPPLEKIDYNKVDNVLKTCQVENNNNNSDSIGSSTITASN